MNTGFRILILGLGLSIYLLNVDVIRLKSDVSMLKQEVKFDFRRDGDAIGRAV